MLLISFIKEAFLPLAGVKQLRANTRKGLIFVFLIWTGLASVPTRTHAAWQDSLEQPALVGQATLTLFFKDIYVARLYAPFALFRPDGDFALSLSYKTDVTKTQIIDASLKMMKKQTNRRPDVYAQWSSHMQTAFRDLKKGDSATAVKKANGGIIFFINGKQTYQVLDAEFASAFMNIWLGPDSPYPKLRDQLLSR